MEPTVLFHNAVHRSSADVDAVLLKRKADAIYAVVAVIRMLFEDLFDLTRKKLTVAALAPVRVQPKKPPRAQLKKPK